MRPLIPLLAIATGLLLAACGSTGSVVLKPGPGAERAASAVGQGAKGSVAGVTVVVDSRVWPGNVPIDGVVTPLDVRIENRSAVPVLVRYDAFSLIDPTGRLFAALPPYRIDAAVLRPRLIAGHPTFPATAFAGERFAVSPIYAPAYPGAPVASDPFSFDPTYYGRYGGQWSKTELPTPEMLRMALPEGRIDPNGSAGGFLYFGKVGSAVPSVRFHVDVRSAESGEPIGAIDIPFVVTTP